MKHLCTTLPTADSNLDFNEVVTNLVANQLLDARLNLADYVDVEKLIGFFAGGSRHNRQREEISWQIELGLADESALDDIPDASPDFNQVETEVISLYSVIRNFTTSVIPTGFGAYYNKICLTDIFNTKQFSSLWTYFTEMSILSVFAQVEEAVSESVTKQIEYQSKKK